MDNTRKLICKKNEFKSMKTIFNTCKYKGRGFITFASVNFRILSIPNLLLKISGPSGKNYY